MSNKVNNKINSDRGFSYIEILMAAAILSISAIPLIAGFYNASINIIHAESYYKASLYAANLFTETQNALKTPAVYFQDGGSWELSGITGNSAFAREYDTDVFDYRLSAFDLSDFSKSFNVSTKSGLPPIERPEFSGAAISSFPEITANDYSIMENEFLQISASALRTNIYADKFTTPAAVSVSASSAVVAAYMPKLRRYEILVMVEVFDKKNAPVHKLVSTLTAEEEAP